MAKNLHCLTSLTEFSSLSPETESKPYLFKSLFKKIREDVPVKVPITRNKSMFKEDGTAQDSEASTPFECGAESPIEQSSEQSVITSISVSSGRDLQNRNMTGVLKMIKSMVEGKKMGLQNYKDSDFKHYWMPDGNCKECYECGDKFTTFRRRHHCRICGQIFCWRCCSQGIPGNLIGYSGDLRVCSYCYKMVFTCMQSLDTDCEVPDDLQSFHGQIQSYNLRSQPRPELSGSSQSVLSPHRRKSSVMGFREEDIAKANPLKSSLGNFCDIDYDGSMSESDTSFLDRTYLLNLYKQLTSQESGISKGKDKTNAWQSHFVQGREIVEWLLVHSYASSSNEALSIGQSFLDVRLLEPCEGQCFDTEAEYELRKVRPEYHHMDSTSENQESMDPLWVKEIQNVNSSVEKDNDTVVDDIDSVDEPIKIQRSESRSRIPSSSSSFYLDLDIKKSRVKVSRPLQSPNLDISSSANYTSEKLLNSDEEKPETVNFDFRYMEGGLCDMFTENLLKAFSASAINKSGSKSSQGDGTLQQLKDDTEKWSAFGELNSVYKNLETNLLRQLLEREALSASWCNTILPIVHRVIETVHPDVKNDVDSMDIRQYVQFKKIPYGSKAECMIVDGVVFSKSVAHRKMEQNVLNPAIMLLSSPITYQRTETKLTSLDPLIMQEFEYLKNTIGKLTVYKPNVLLVEKCVSRVAQEMLLNFGITVALNVKPTVMERVARCTKAAVVSTVDAHLGKPQLGTCQEFKVKTYNISSGETKTLMFLDGCLSDLGCTILLRGGSANELKKVKQIVQFMLYVAYNWQLERYFLMDEFAMPPVSSALNLFDSPKILSSTNSTGTSFSEAGNKRSEENTSVAKCETDVSSAAKGKMRTDDASRRLETKHIDDFSDPLHSYLQAESDVPFSGPTDFHVNTLPKSNTFRKLLDDVILCCSLNVKVTLPYLETDAGKHCPLRKFFPGEIYWSSYFAKENDSKILQAMQVNFDDNTEPCENYVNSSSAAIHPVHSFVTCKFIDMSSATSDMYSFLADYRARGCTIRYLCPHQQRLKEVERKQGATDVQFSEKDSLKPNEIIVDASSFWERKIDALDPYNHQKLEVLFCSYSCTSNNAPNYCVNPWVVKMDFYGSNDIPFGGFLEKYCFRSSYVCPSAACDTPMTGHVRKFVHESGCVRIVLLEYSSGVQTADTNILMWSWCPKCKQASSVVPMSKETWSFSFAKYLELRFYASSYRRQATSDLCMHSLHHDHNQYFAHKQIVAVIEYNPISVREIVMPLITIPIQDEALSVASVVDQVKNLAIKGSEVYSTVLEKLITFKQQYSGTSSEAFIANMIASQKAEMSLFRDKIEQIQLTLTSSTLENMLQVQGKNAGKGICTFMWKVEDQVTLLKYHIYLAVQSWNSRIQKFVTERKKEEKQLPKLQLSKAYETEDSVTPNLTGSIDGSSEMDPKYGPWNSAPKLCEPLPCDDAIITTAPGLSHETTSASTGLQQLSTALNFAGNQLYRKHKLQSFSWLERSISCESISETLNAAKGKVSLFKSSSEPAILTYDDASVNIPKADADEDKHSISSSASSYTYGATPGIYAGLMVPPPEDDESYVVCHKAPCDHKQFSGCTARGHERSKSEGQDMSVDSLSKVSQEHEDGGKKEKKERTVKTLLTQLLSGSDVILIQSPFLPTEHVVPCVTEREMIPVIVCEDEPSSIIAYTLASPEYEQKLQEVKTNVIATLSTTQRDSQTSSPLIKRRQTSKPAGDSSSVADGLSLQTDESLDVLDMVTGSSQEAEKTGVKSGIKMSACHLEVQFNDNSTKFYCRVYYAEQFRKLRCLVFEEGEDRFIRSLAHCVPWAVRGGKSGSTFCKTQDDRFILKQMQKLELQSFLDLAPSYFSYINKACLEQKPTLLAKIVGVYRIGYKNGVTNSASKMDLLVMENLFYGCNITRKYDLKGSVRNRLVNTSGLQEDDIVLLDENLLKITCDNPLYIRPHSKVILSLAIDNDTQFLSDQSVMDYSLLVGMDEEKKELIIGIIDYIRTFTWDKKVEMIVKASGILGGHGKMPTVVSPELYRMRFREAMDGYFLWVPDRWTNLGQSINV